MRARALDHAHRPAAAGGRGAGLAADPGRQSATASPSPCPRAARDLADVLGDFETLIAPYRRGQHPSALLRLGPWRRHAGRHGRRAAGRRASTPTAAGATTSARSSSARSRSGRPRRSGSRRPVPASSSPGPPRPTSSALLVARDAALGHDVRRTGLEAATRSSPPTPRPRPTPASPRPWSWPASARTTCARSRPTPPARCSSTAAPRHRRRPRRGTARRSWSSARPAGSISAPSTTWRALADLCAAERLWFHVDGAFGALAALSPALKPLTRGLERAHSVAFDFHKWAHVPYDAGFLLVRDPARTAGPSPRRPPTSPARPAAWPPARTGPATSAPTSAAVSAR